MRVAPPVVDDPSPAPPAPTSGRALAARALLGAGCTQARAGALLGVSRRTIRGDIQVGAARRDADTLTRARVCLADSERRGSTAAERDTALAWLDQALHEPPGTPDDHPMGEGSRLEPAREDDVWARASWLPAGPPADRPEPQAASPGPTGEVSPPGPPRDKPTPRPPAALPRGAPREPRRLVRGRPRSPSTHARAPIVSRPRPTRAPSPSPAPGLALEQVHALTQQQRRIEHRSLILECAVKTLDPPPMREAVADLCADILEAARAIGVIVRQATR